MSSPGPSTCKCIGRGVRNFASAVLEQGKTKRRVVWHLRQKFTRNLAMKKHLLSTSIKILAEAQGLWAQCGALVSKRMIPGLMNHGSGEGKNCSVRHFLPFEKQFAKVKPGRRTRPPLVGSALAPRTQEPKKIRQRRGRAVHRG